MDQRLKPGEDGSAVVSPSGESLVPSREPGVNCNVDLVRRGQHSSNIEIMAQRANMMLAQAGGDFPFLFSAWLRVFYFVFAGCGELILFLPGCGEFRASIF